MITVHCAGHDKSWEHAVSVHDVHVYFGAVGRLEKHASDFCTLEKDHILDEGAYDLNVFWDCPIEDDRMCRVCREGETVSEHLYHPCKCNGSIKWVHETCLLSWISRSNSMNCELCHEEFTFTKVYDATAPVTLQAHHVVKYISQHIYNFIVQAVRYLVACFIWLIAVPLSTSLLTQLMLSCWNETVTPHSFWTEHTSSWRGIAQDTWMGLLEFAMMIVTFFCVALWRDWCKNNLQAVPELQDALLFNNNAEITLRLVNTFGQVQQAIHAQQSGMPPAVLAAVAASAAAAAITAATTSEVVATQTEKGWDSPRSSMSISSEEQCLPTASLRSPTPTTPTFPNPPMSVIQPPASSSHSSTTPHTPTFPKQQPTSSTSATAAPRHPPLASPKQDKRVAVREFPHVVNILKNKARAERSRQGGSITGHHQHQSTPADLLLGEQGEGHHPDQAVSLLEFCMQPNPQACVWGALRVHFQVHCKHPSYCSYTAFPSHTLFIHNTAHTLPLHCPYTAIHCPCTLR
eukprot:NODE_488_length_1638_cov_110.237256_g348_i0.p1 GENE.NODE_488_length_1638_cov_110.237256_g348_i0~~NODE_488_length_1638_cov_110.237256_g348_i0.p1  ORF type:complete len:539 (-),score=101.92 NODE_488_length_1638_cov_110.237256_g348_i0:22-1575(-)